MTGVIGFFVVVACAATLHADGRSIEDASDAADALSPLAGDLASLLFGAGLLGASLLAASILPLSTAYSISEALGDESAVDDPIGDAPVFYGSYGVVVALAAAVVVVPGAPLVDILFLSQALNAVLLLVLLPFIRSLAADRELMGANALGRFDRVSTALALGLVAVSVLALGVLALL
jgi:Mn2+/Fe2+ NRAMP family transporter